MPRYLVTTIIKGRNFYQIEADSPKAAEDRFYALMDQGGGLEPDEEEREEGYINAVEEIK